MEKSKVYFTKEITPESVVKIYETLGVNLPGKVAVKLHSGEQGNQNYIRPEFVKAIVDGSKRNSCRMQYRLWWSKKYNRKTRKTYGRTWMD